MLEKIILWAATGLVALVRLGDPRTTAAPLTVSLFAAGALLGAAHPEGAWSRALVLGLSVPLAQALAGAAHVTLPYAPANVGAAFLALVPAGLGTCVGVVMRRALGAVTADATRPGRPS